MTNTPVTRLIQKALHFSNIAAGEGVIIDGESPEEFLLDYTLATGDEDWDTLSDRILADLPTPMTMEAAAKVLLDQPYTVMRKAFDAMDSIQGEGADRIMSAALRALSGEKS